MEKNNKNIPAIRVPAPHPHSVLTGHHDDFSSFTRRIQNKYRSYPWSPLLKKESINFIKKLLGSLFPHFSEKSLPVKKEILEAIRTLESDLVHLIGLLGDEKPGNIPEIAKKFVHQLPNVYNNLWKDARAICQGDPAATGMNEVIIAYPGFFAIAVYRIAHELSALHLPVIPRILTEYAHSRTGIDIHPGAQIGSPFVIDHGTGVVIGESSIIGKNVKMYHGVTLGALTVNKSQAKIKRHPTIEDGVVIYSQAVILGGNTVIGKKCIIGGNTWIIRSIPPNTIVYNKTDVRSRNSETGKEIQ